MAARSSHRPGGGHGSEHKYHGWLLPHTSYPTRIVSTYQSLPKVKVDFNPHLSLDMRFPANKTALYVEPRSSITHIAPLLTHMMEVVPPEWRFVFLGSSKTIEMLHSSGAIRKYLGIGKLHIRMLEDKWAKAWGPRWDDLDIEEMNNRLLTNLSFYDEELRGAEHLLVFQSDSILCASAGMDLEDWLVWDWVGAPWQNGPKYGGSGGLSLRRVSKIREVLTFQKRMDGTTPEDRWLSARLALLPGANMAPSEIENKFAVEEVWYEWPMGYVVNHLRGDYWPMQQKRKDLFYYCPDIKIILDMKLSRERCPEKEPEKEPEPEPRKDPVSVDSAHVVDKTQEDFDTERNNVPGKGEAADLLKEHLKDIEADEDGTEKESKADIPEVQAEVELSTNDVAEVEPNTVATSELKGPTQTFPVASVATSNEDSKDEIAAESNLDGESTQTSPAADTIAMLSSIDPSVPSTIER